MNLFTLLGLMDQVVTPTTCKVHLASHNGNENPLSVYFEDWFDEWQSWQSKRNFSRDYVVSLIQLPEGNQWLYVGTYAVKGERWDEKEESYWYTLEVLPSCSEFAGRLVISFERPGRNAYLLGETCAEQLAVYEIRHERMHLEDFPGFKKVNLSWPDLEILVRQNVTSWRTALSNVAGVYLITDTQDAKLYVGSATGEGGIWGRWCHYLDGHGNNVELFKLIGEYGRERANAFRFSILEIADMQASSEEVRERESHWKEILLSRSAGYNAN